MLGLLLGALAGLNGLAYRHARAMLSFQSGGERTAAPEQLAPLAKLHVLLLGVGVPRPHSTRSPSALDPSCRSLTIAAHQAVTLASWYCGERARAPLVILFHGYAAEKSGLTEKARPSLGLGASVLLVDFRGSGGASESRTTLGAPEAQDVRAVVDYARSAPAHPSLILYGQSIGAAAILRAVSARGVTADGVILEGVFDTLLNAVRNRFRAMGVPAFPSAELILFWGGRQAGVDGFGLNPVADAASLRAPVLFLHGAEERRATLAQARRVHASVPVEKALHVFRWCRTWPSGLPAPRRVEGGGRQLPAAGGLPRNPMGLTGQGRV